MKIHKLYILLVCFISFFSTCDFIPRDDYYRAEPSGFVIQPKSIPDYPEHISVDIPQNFPDINTIINAPFPRISVCGLFTGATFFGDHNPWDIEVEAVGWKSLRPCANNDSMLNPISRDDIMKRLIAMNVETLWTVCGTTEYARGAEKYGSIDDANGDAEFINDYINDFLSPLLERYGPGGTFFVDNPGIPTDKHIKYVEIWNEPNLHYLYGEDVQFTSTPEGIIKKAELYAKLLHDSYIYIKDNPNHPNWADIQVVGLAACGGSRADISGGPDENGAFSWDNGFIKMVHENLFQEYGSADFYDILSDHPYTRRAPPDAEIYPLGIGTNNDDYHYSPANSLAIYKQIMEDFGCGDKPVWFTEAGWMRDPAANTTQPTIPERLQAAYIVRLYLITLRIGVETTHVMFMFDYGDRKFGFFYNQNRKWHESAYAVQNLIKIMPNPRIKEAISDGENGYYAYAYQPDFTTSGKKTVIVAWNVAGPKSVSIPVSNHEYYKIIDMFGHEKIEYAYRNLELISVEIGPYPIYIVKE